MRKDRTKVIFPFIQRVYDFFMKTDLKRTKFGPPKTGFGFGVGGGDGQDKVDRVRAHFEANPEDHVRPAAAALQVRLCTIWSHFIWIDIPLRSFVRPRPSN